MACTSTPAESTGLIISAFMQQGEQSSPRTAELAGDHMKTPIVARTLTAAVAALALLTVCAGSAWAQHGGGGGHGGGGHGGGGFGGGGGFHGGGGGFHGGPGMHGGFRGGYGGYRGGYYGGFRGGYGFRGYGWGWAPGWGWWWGGWGWPLGVYLSVLPWYYSTYYWDGIPYYYANGGYYIWNGTEGEYEQVQPPPEVAEQGAGGAPSASGPPTGTPSAGAPPMSEELYAYPKNGQSTEQQATDKSQCRAWASGQVAGAPPPPSGARNAAPGAPGAEGTPGAAPADVAQRQNYLRAEAACLEARGYSVQ
jgi:hypothetical protein